jgi:hypothetical protein
MKAMKGLSMKSMLGSVRGRSGGKYRYVFACAGGSADRTTAQDGASVNGAGGSQLDTPEANAARSVVRIANILQTTFR